MDEREAMIRQEKMAFKKHDKEKEISRISKIQEYPRELKLQVIKEKNYKTEEFKYFFLFNRNQKVQMMKQRKDLAENIGKQKKNALNKFEGIVKKNKDITVKDI